MVSKPTILDERILSKAVTIGFLAMPGNDAGNISICCFDYWRDDSRLKKTAAEFFFSSVPTMLAVAVYSVFVKTWGKRN
jgi:undecaprenyl-diphosphatase